MKKRGLKIKGIMIGIWVFGTCFFYREVKEQINVRERLANVIKREFIQTEISLLLPAMQKPDTSHMLGQLVFDFAFWTSPGYRYGIENNREGIFLAEGYEGDEMEMILMRQEEEKTGNEIAEEQSPHTFWSDDCSVSSIESKQQNKEQPSLVEQKSYTAQQLYDESFIQKEFYVVDSTTMLGQHQLNAKKFLNKDLSVKKNTKEPVILIYHTHSQEAFSDSRAGVEEDTIVGVGSYLTELLEKKGYTVMHHKGQYDIESRDAAYTNACPSIEKLLKENPSIEVVIDLHRDGVSEGTRLVTNVNGKQTASIMFFNGLSRTKRSGDLGYLYNPYIEDNLAFSFQMQLAAKKYYPGFSRAIYLKGYRYNMHLRPKSLLIEAGAQTNTVEEEYNAMEPLAELLESVLSKSK